MENLFILMVPAGLILFFVGGRWMYAALKSKEIIKFPLDNQKQEFRVDKPGLFSFSLIGGGYVKNSGGFRASVKRKEYHIKVESHEPFIKAIIMKNWRIGVEYLHFKISDSGIYIVEIDGVKDLVIKGSILKIKQLYQRSIPSKYIEVSIRETIPPTKQLFGIIFFVLGANITAWGIILGLNLNIS